MVRLQQRARSESKIHKDLLDSVIYTKQGQYFAIGAQAFMTMAAFSFEILIASIRSAPVSLFVVTLASILLSVATTYACRYLAFQALLLNLFSLINTIFSAMILLLAVVFLLTMPAHMQTDVFYAVMVLMFLHGVATMYCTYRIFMHTTSRLHATVSVLA